MEKISKYLNSIMIACFIVMTLMYLISEIFGKKVALAIAHEFLVVGAIMVVTGTAYCFIEIKEQLAKRKLQN